MSDNELRLIKFGVYNYYAILVNHRPHLVIQLLHQIVEGLLESEDKPEKEDIDRLNWIYENTHESVNLFLPDVENLVIENLRIRNYLNKELTMDGKTFQLRLLMRYLSQVQRELRKIVIRVAKKYGVDLPLDSNIVKKSSDGASLI